ncbi:hypothetical protein N7925_28460 [Streptomyces sp. CA-278952]|uniref:hypothetical protein n=1 Tax=unclassified Streptomyces TaxID=2593676 RepID=UPI0022418BF3|nr:MULTISPECIES: hypothetical protein [unclassified Streptomyces]UZI31932.1 hypothetical protein OH133_29705 [Streptomyces sp. VB1]WDG31981.1 hypothetical protein N7925_28460 [Streptomyces sp. CA-278952]
MSVTATVPRRRRRLGIAAGASLLALAVSGCSGLGRTAVGPVTYTTEREAVLQVNSPSVRGCHRIAPAGAREVENGTLVDAIMYRTPDCTGGSTIYVPTGFSDVTATGSEPWRSYSFVH